MSAAINDRTHDALLSRLPLTGEFHPLRREFERLLATGNVIALTFAMLACTIVYFWPREAELPIDTDSVPQLFKQARYWVDPSVKSTGTRQIGNPDVIPEHFIAEPVDDLDPRVETPVEPGLPGEPGPEGPVTELPAIGGPPLDIPSQTPPQEDYTWFDNEPVLLSCDPPVYPSMVSDAGIDGTVMVRVLVGVNGKVRDARVVDGPAVLREAALASARTALFKPALQGVHPVEVWVVMPITFQLRGDH